MENNLRQAVEKILPQVNKPGQYVGGELHSIIKEPASVSTRFGFAFPDVYEIGMSYLGLQIIYNLLNKEEDVYCERVFAPAMDMEEQMRSEGIPLFTMETTTAVRDMDILGFTLQYEMSYTNIINMLDLAGIPLHGQDRSEDMPFVCAGGPCAFHPEPLADFIDFFMIGDGEEVLIDICRAHKEWKEAGETREEFLKRAACIQGVYVPRFYQPVYGEDGVITGMEKLYDQAPDRVLRRFIQNLDKAPFPENPIVPLVETVHDRSVVEIFRGCTRGCRFCQAGILYRPVRERSKDEVCRLAQSQLAASGWDELSILSLSTSDHSEIEPMVMDLMDHCRKKNVSLSLPSLRLDSFSFSVLQEIQRFKKTGLTFAPEAGTQRLRDVINKTITDDHIYGAVRQAAQLGWNSVKLYFMVGLPTETYEDLDGIVQIARNLSHIYYDVNGGKKGARFSITVSVSNFVPKPHTPFQRFPQNSPEEFREKNIYLKEKLRPLKNVHFNYHETETSRLEAVIAKGDRRVSAVIEQAWRLGCRFDSWREHFNYERWQQAMKDTGVDGNFYAERDMKDDRFLPWSHIDSGVSETFFNSEWEKAMQGQVTEDCRRGCVGCGVNGHAVCEREGSLCS